MKQTFSIMITSRIFDGNKLKLCSNLTKKLKNSLLKNHMP